MSCRFISCVGSPTPTRKAACIAAVLLVATLLLAQASAIAAPANRRGSRVSPPPGLVNAGSNTGSRTLFLNRCEGGCTVEPGFEDSRSNHSSIISSTRQISEWSHSEQEWESMLRCVQELYAPFDVLVTDEDPQQEPHFEAIVAGSPGEAGFPRAGGVAPFSCGVIDNAITYTFAAIYDDMREICNVVGQESAHAFGLDHEVECADPMTYIGGCPIKSFQDVDARCGEFDFRECSCGDETQNSFRYLLDLFGAGLVPQVFIGTPEDRSEVALGFPISVTAVDDHQVTRSELWIDGLLVDSQSEAPFEYLAPRTLSPGEHEVQVRVFDDREQYGSRTVTVFQDRCWSTSQCDFSFLCLAGQCVLGPGNAGGIGDACVGSEDCQSLQCGRDDPSPPGVCTASCFSAEANCPYGFECVPVRSEGPGRRLVCMPIRVSSGGGFCNSSGSTSSAIWGLLLLLCGLYGTRQHHVQARNREPKG